MSDPLIVRYPDIQTIPKSVSSLWKVKILCHTAGMDSGNGRGPSGGIAWVRRDPEVHVAGDTGGDIQVGEAYDARWTRPLEDGLTAMVSRAYYAIREPVTNNLALERQTEYLACTDPTDPGSTEQWSEYTYEPEYGFSPTDLGARAAAYGAEPPTDGEWDEVAPEDLATPEDVDDDVDGWG